MSYGLSSLTFVLRYSLKRNQGVRTFSTKAKAPKSGDGGKKFTGTANKAVLVRQLIGQPFAGPFPICLPQQMIFLPLLRHSGYGKRYDL